MDQATCQRKNITVPINPKLGDIVLDPNGPKFEIKSNCGKATKATICDRNLRTFNTHAKCGSPEDVYY